MRLAFASEGGRHRTVSGSSRSKTDIKARSVADGYLWTKSDAIFGASWQRAWKSHVFFLPNSHVAAMSGSFAD